MEKYQNAAQEVTNAVLLPPWELTNSFIIKYRYIVAITPLYDVDNSNGAMVTYCDGTQEYYNCRCDFLVGELAKVFRTSIVLARSRAQFVLGDGAKHKPPLALNKQLCFVQLKYRKAEKKGHGTVAYVVLQYIQKVAYQENGNGVIIFHKGAPPLPLQQQYRSVVNQIKMAKKLQAYIQFEDKFWEHDSNMAAMQLAGENWKADSNGNAGEELKRLQKENQLIMEQNRRMREELAKQNAKNYRDKKK